MVNAIRRYIIYSIAHGCYIQVNENNYNDLNMKKHLLTLSIALMSLTSASTLATTYISAKALLDVETGELKANPLIAIDNGVISQIQFNKKAQA